jgi:hypothetical protein
MSGIVWALTRLQAQCDAIVAALDRVQPGFYQVYVDEVMRIRSDGRLVRAFAETQREIAQASDWTWLKSQGIDPDSKTT